MIIDESRSFVIATAGDGPDTELVWYRPMSAGWLSIVIPCYNDVCGLCDTLDSLDFIQSEKQVEIIVANDGGNPEVRQVSLSKGVLCVEIMPNMGSYAARNFAIERSCGEWIAFIDADIQVSPNWLTAFLKWDKNADVGVGRVHMKLPERPTLADWYQAVSYFPPELVEKGFLQTAHLLVRRRVFEELGGFDRRLRSTGDYEFSLRLRMYREYLIKTINEMEAWHPCRSWKQLLGSAERTLYGQMNLIKLYGESAKPAASALGPWWKWLLPRRRLFNHQDVIKRMSIILKFGVWFFAWGLKIRLLPVYFRISQQLRASGARVTDM